MKKVLALALMVLGLSAVALAGQITTPEIGGAAAVSALTLVAGAALVIRSRKNQ